MARFAEAIQTLIAAKKEITCVALGRPARGVPEKEKEEGGEDKPAGEPAAVAPKKEEKPPKDKENAPKENADEGDKDDDEEITKVEKVKIEIFIDKEQEIEGASWQGVSLVTEEQDLVFNYRSGKAISGGFWSFTLLYSGAKGEVCVGAGLFTQDISHHFSRTASCTAPSPTSGATSSTTWAAARSPRQW